MFFSAPRVNTDPHLVDEALSRSIAEVLPSKEAFRAALLSGRRLRMYIGADATGPQLHLGHSTNFLLLERMRKLGHEIIILFGDFTAMIGDPTDKEATRVQLSKEEVEHNIRTWKSQVAKVVAFSGQNPARIVRNSAWNSKLSFGDVIRLAGNFTVQHMLERDMFEKRMQEGKPIYLHEFLYPLVQGYDSVAMDVDVEVGGTDQTFNMLAGRTLQRKLNERGKFVVATSLLAHPKTGKKLMSKSEGGYIAMDDTPEDMYGKTMALPDEVIERIFTDCTNLPLAEVAALVAEMRQGALSALDFKKRLARELVTLYHGESAAGRAEEGFARTFSKGEMPPDAPTVTFPRGTKLRDAVARVADLSGSAAARLIEQGGVEEIGGGKHAEPSFPLERDMNVRIGKKSFVRIQIT